MTSTPKLGVIAGGGHAPWELIRACERIGRPFFVICLEGQADKKLCVDVPHVWLGLGAFGALKQLCEKQGIDEIVMLGHVRRPSITELKPDWLGLRVMTRIGLGTLGDDGLLRAVGQAIEEECGVRVVGAHEVLHDLLTPAGFLTKSRPDERAQQDIARAKEVVRALGLLDVGQAAVVQDGIVLGVEAIEGTDALIERAGSLKRGGGGGVLVKLAKPQQDNRYDLPTIGPETIRHLAQAGLSGVAVEAGRSLFVDRESAITVADELGLFVVGIEGSAHE